MISYYNSFLPFCKSDSGIYDKHTALVFFSCTDFVAFIHPCCTFAKLYHRGSFGKFFCRDSRKVISRVI